jgi:hypothetical protein
MLMLLDRPTQVCKRSTGSSGADSLVLTALVVPYETAVNGAKKESSTGAWTLPKSICAEDSRLVAMLCNADQFDSLLNKRDCFDYQALHSALRTLLTDDDDMACITPWSWRCRRGV